MTDKLREAAQEALEVLEQLQGGCTDSDDGTVEVITVWCPEVIDTLRAALAQQDAQAVPLVTEQMIAAGQYAWMTADGVDPVRVFSAMLNAAPTPPAQQDAQAVYQYQKSDGSWIDQTESSYQYNAQNGATNLRVLYAAPTPPARSVEAQAVRDGIDAAINFLESGDDYEVKRKIMAAALRCSGLIFDLWWRAAPTPPAQQPLTVEQYTEIAHRTASRYAHRSDPKQVCYTFFPHTLDDFVRRLEAAHNIGTKP